MTAGWAATIAVLDAAQPLLLAWRPKFYGSLAGAALYAAFAVALLRGEGRLALYGVALMPVVPLAALTGNALGASFPVDREMLAILVVQLIAAASSVLALRARAPVLR